MVCLPTFIIKFNQISNLGINIRPMDPMRINHDAKKTHKGNFPNVFFCVKKLEYNFYHQTVEVFSYQAERKPPTPKFNIALET